MKNPGMSVGLAVPASVMILAVAAVLGVGKAQAGSYDDFATDPNIAGDWVNSAFYGSVGTATWNAGAQNLSLVGDTGDRWSVLCRTGATRGASDPVTLQINSLSAVGIDWALVGLAISSDTAPTISGTNPRYMFTVQTTDQGANWFYRVARDANNVLFDSAKIPSGSLSLPIRLDIVRNGANYDFKVNDITVYTASYYSSAQHDSMVYYHITWASGQHASLSATVDNFGIPPPAGTVISIR